MKQDRCGLFCGRGLQLTPRDWEQCLEVGHQGKYRYNLVEGDLVLRAGMAENGEHTQVNAGFYSLIERVRIGERRVKSLYRPKREGAVDRCGRSCGKK